jgi:excisionase family DNA binding protein
MDNNKLMDNRELLTTGQAATLCAVTRNTVFKWVQSGYLSAIRTAGGHHRIDRRDLDRLLAHNDHASSDADQTEARPGYQYCWEYNGNGKTQDECLNCAVYQMRALRCYEVAKLAPSANHPKHFCDQRCEDCDYFQEMHGKKANVLVVTNDQVLAGDLLSHADEANFYLEITDCEYNCSAIVNHFKPDFVIIDCNLGQRVSQQMSSHIMKDPRIPYVRVVLAGGNDEFPAQCDKEIFARMTRPFGITGISECINLNQDAARDQIGS